MLASILSTSTGRCWSLDSYNPVPGVLENVPSSREYKGGFGNSLLKKDLGLAVEAAQATNSPILLGASAHQTWTQLSKTKGYEDKDMSSIFKWLNQK